MAFRYKTLIASLIVGRQTTSPYIHRALSMNTNIQNISGVGLQYIRPHLALLNPFRSHILTATFSQRVEYEASVKNISQKLRELAKNPVEELQIIDSLQRVGIDHLFRKEISEALHHHYLEYYTTSRHECHSPDLQHASLRFRLLRDQGHHISSTGTFGDYIGEGGEFDGQRLGNVDIRGILSMFEASQMSTEAETMLDEAKIYTEQLLCASINGTCSVEESRARLVHNTLKHPQHMTFARFKSKDLIREFEHAGGWRKEMADLGAMEFERARRTYKDEILHISKWWKELGLTEELKHARDEPLEWHIWSVGILADPSLAKERIELSKPVSLIYIIDDIFDIYGHPNDLCLFTESVNRWDLTSVEKLPDYMKRCLKALFETTSDISQKIRAKHGFNPEHHLRKAWADLFSAYLVEFKWFASGYLPTTQQYMETGTTTTGVHVVLLHMMFLSGQGVNYVTQIDTHIYTSIISSVAAILRLWNDLGKAKIQDYEGQVGHDGSYIKCYMKENIGVSLKATEDHILWRVSNEWKRLNGLCLRLPPTYPHSSPYTNLTFKNGCLNLARIVPLMYDYDRIRCKPVLEELMHSLLT